MPAAIAIPALIGGAASIGGAAIASSASKGAAQTQATSANQALGLQRQIYGNQLQAQAPYQQLGQNALGQLGAMAGRYGQLYGQGSSPTPAMAPPQGPQSLPQAPMNPAASSPQPQQGAMPPSGGQMWTVRAPTGETAQLSPDMAQQAIAKGAQRIG